MSESSRNYLSAVTELLATIEREEQGSIDKAAEVLANATSQGRLIHVIGPGGHSNMAVEETFWRAGGLASINAILDPGTNLIHGARRSSMIERTPGYAKSVLDAYGVENGDPLIIVNAYGINSMTIECALECKARGATSIAITSRSFADNVPAGAPARHPSGQNLYQLADIFINNHMPYGDAIVPIDGVPQKMGPTSTFANVFSINLLMMKTVEKMITMGIKPAIWTSGNLPEGDSLNKGYLEEYGPRVKLLR